MSNVLDTYHEKRGASRRTFTLSEDRLRISGTDWMKGMAGDVEFSLDVFSTSFGAAELRNDNYDLAIILTLVSATLAALALLAVPFIAGGVAIALFAAGLLFWLIRNRGQRIVVYRFFNRGGVEIVDVYASGPEAHRCQEFAESLREAIRRWNPKGVPEPTGLE